MGLMHTNIKKREKNEGQVRRAEKTEGIEAQRVKPFTPARATIGKRGKRTEWKTEKEQKERNKEWVPNQPTPDHLVVFYDPHGLYVGPILKPLRPQRERRVSSFLKPSAISFRTLALHFLELENTHLVPTQNSEQFFKFLVLSKVRLY